MRSGVENLNVLGWNPFLVVWSEPASYLQFSSSDITVSHVVVYFSHNSTYLIFYSNLVVLQVIEFKYGLLTIFDWVVGSKMMVTHTFRSWQSLVADIF